jgi:site-specific DNA recombinase
MSRQLSRSPTRTKRALSYLRVSSDGQVNTDYVRDGLSIEVQRDKRDTKAAELDAEVVEEFVDPGRSAWVDLHKRKDFLLLLDRLREYNASPGTFIDFVIFLDLSRWTRSAEDHFRCRRLVRETGARLVSIHEPMVGEDTPEAFVMEGWLAVNNEYESMKISRRARLGIHKKASYGGSYGGRRLGYVKCVVTLPEGRQVSDVAVDPDRHAFITAAFKLYASENYSIPQLSDELHRLGLRSFPTRRYPEGKVGTAALQRLLRNPYYAGWIVYRRGKPDAETFKGRHPTLIDQETFDQVQRLLDEKRVAGERPRKRQHYLRGSVFCAACGSRLTYGVSTGENGRGYAYYFCASRVNRTPCSERANIRPELIEAAIQRMYRERPVYIGTDDLERRKEAVRAMASVAQESLEYVRATQTELIARLEGKQDALVEMRFGEKSISAEVFKRKQAKLDAEIAAAKQSRAETEGRLKLEQDDLVMALELAGDVAKVYAEADERTRRGYNQAFFTRIKIKARWDDEQRRPHVEVAGVELTEPYAALLAENTTDEAMAWVRAVQATSAQNARKRPQEPSKRLPRAFSGGDLSIFVKLAEREGFEPSNEVDPRYAISNRARSAAPAPLQRTSTAYAATDPIVRDRRCRS